MRVTKFKTKGGFSWLTLRADDKSYCVITLPFAAEYSSNEDGTAINIKPLSGKGIMEDALREMELDDAADFGMTDIGNK